MTMPMAWRLRWWRWALPLAVVIANAVVLIVHPGRTGAGFADMEKALASESHALRALGEKEEIAAIRRDGVACILRPGLDFSFLRRVWVGLTTGRSVFSLWTHYIYDKKTTCRGLTEKQKV